MSLYYVERLLNLKYPEKCNIITAYETDKITGKYMYDNLKDFGYDRTYIGDKEVIRIDLDFSGVGYVVFDDIKKDLIQYIRDEKINHILG